MDIAFWCAIALLAYTFVVYPVAIASLAGVLGGRDMQRRDFVGSVSVVMCVFNEAERVARRVAELTQLLSNSGLAGELIVVSDGSTDATCAHARNAADSNTTILELPENVGKAAALSKGAELAKHDVLVFADVRQRWSVGTLTALLRPFADPRVGAASGELILETAEGTLEGLGLYWRFEKFLRRCESTVHSTAGVTGAVCAVRRTCFAPVPAGTILDDVYWPMHVVLTGRRVVFVADAVAFDALPARARDEFRRKVRTLSGNFQLVALMPVLLLPWRNPIWWQFASHKLLRLIAPWALIVAFATSAFLPAPYSVFFALQLLGYLTAAAGLVFPDGALARRVSPLTSFVLLNAAAFVAFWTFASGRTASAWTKAAYADTPRGPDTLR